MRSKRNSLLLVGVSLSGKHLGTDYSELREIWQHTTFISRAARPKVRNDFLPFRRSFVEAMPKAVASLRSATRAVLYDASAVKSRPRQPPARVSPVDGRVPPCDCFFAASGEGLRRGYHSLSFRNSQTGTEAIK